jgi:hypothetical protein
VGHGGEAPTSHQSWSKFRRGTLRTTKNRARKPNYENVTPSETIQCRATACTWRAPPASPTRTQSIK